MFVVIGLSGKDCMFCEDLSEAKNQFHYHATFENPAMILQLTDEESLRVNEIRKSCVGLYLKGHKELIKEINSIIETRRLK